MSIKHIVSTLLILACLLVACGSPTASPEDQQFVITPTVTSADQQHAVRVILELPPDELGDVCELEAQVECDTQGNIMKLGLSDSQMISLPSEIGQLTNLKELDLSNNQLTSLPPEIGQLTSLYLLDLHNNQLTSLPPEIGQMTNLYFLHLRDNQLTSLPLEIGKLTRLKVLYIFDNPLKKLPPELCAKFWDVDLEPSSLCL